MLTTKCCNVIDDATIEAVAQVLYSYRQLPHFALGDWPCQTRYMYIMGSSYVIVISQAQVGYHCYYTRPRARPKVKCYNNDILRVFKHLCGIPNKAIRRSSIECFMTCTAYVGAFGAISNKFMLFSNAVLFGLTMKDS